MSVCECVSVCVCVSVCECGSWKELDREKMKEVSRQVKVKRMSNIAGQIINYKLEKKILKRRKEVHIKLYQHSSDKRFINNFEEIQTCIYNSTK